jgi:factor associated with neutral sphingomyelinase activation
MEFDSSRLVNFSERILLNSAAAQHTPLLRESGRLVVTDQHIYFQPLHNISGAAA